MATGRLTPSKVPPRPHERPAGLRILLPGYPQYLWRQTERAAALSGTYAAAMGVGMFGWGSRTGLAMIALAFLTHVASAADVLKQTAFPGFGRFVPAVSATFGLGFGCYGPALMMAWVLAWPQGPSGSEQERYAINLWAFRSAQPRPGDWVWHKTPNGAGYGLGRVVAGPGQAVEWTPAGLTVDGRPLDWAPLTPDGAPLELAMTVPDGQVLIAPRAFTPDAISSCGLRLIARDGVVGRPWARIYPVWNRGLLF